MRRPLVLTLAVLTIAGAGCGDDGADKDAYLEDVKKVGQTLSRELDSLGASQGAKSSKVIVKQLEESTDALAEAAADLDEIDPPGEVAEAHAQIVDGVKDIASDFRTAAKAAAAGDEPTVTSTLTGISASEGARKIQQGQAELRKKGYKVDDK